MNEYRNTFGRELRRYAFGLALAVLLTGAAFAAVLWHIASPPILLVLVFGLGLLQVIVHFHFFLHIGLKKSTRDDLQLILFSTLIILLMVGGTLVILLNLRHRMM